jgi:hypothetical protein
MNSQFMRSHIAATRDVRSRRTWLVAVRYVHYIELMQRKVLGKLPDVWNVYVQYSVVMLKIDGWFIGRRIKLLIQ